MSTSSALGDALATGTIDIEIADRAELECYPHWRRAFAAQRKDHRYYLHETLDQSFDYHYFVIKDASGDVLAIQPFFLLDQNMLAGVSGADRVAAAIRRIWPRFLHLRTIMIGCAAGEGHVDEAGGGAAMPLLAANITELARKLGAHLIVLKEFPANYRSQLRCFEAKGFKRIPSMPMTSLNIDFANFDDYVAKRLSAKTRRDLRRKLKAADNAAPIDMAVVRDVTPVIQEIYPLYLQVFQRSKLHFEKLTPEFFCRLGQIMPDRARFFLWRQRGRLVAFALCLVRETEVFGEYLGLDYEVALDLHLYHHVTRDVINWAIANGYKTFRSGGLNYDPKLHLRHVLDPLDLYIRHASPVLNRILKLLLPLIEPTRYDPTLRKFPNYKDLWGDQNPVSEMEVSQRNALAQGGARQKTNGSQLRKSQCEHLRAAIPSGTGPHRKSSKSKPRHGEST
jgi:predicted N-acyltransferase